MISLNGKVICEMAWGLQAIKLLIVWFTVEAEAFPFKYLLQDLHNF